MMTKLENLKAVLVAFMLCTATTTTAQKSVKTYPIVGTNFKANGNMSAPGDNKGETVRFELKDRGILPYNQAAVKQTTEQASYGPKENKPYFTVRFALPIPPSYTRTETAALTGIDFGVYHHNHSPGFEIMPNGDALAIYFSTPRGLAEKDTATTWVQARLRYGSEEWDMPELLYTTQGGNDQSGLLWNDNGKIWFFGGGRSMSDYVPFRTATSTDNGVHWDFWIPRIEKRPTDFTAQPITNAFRDSKGNIYMAMDADGSQSFLWRSSDEGKTWQDMGGRTTGRHSTIVPLDNQGTLLSIGGKNANVDGWTPQNISHDWGKTWDKATAAPFPQLGSGQRPSLIRLQSGNLIYVSDGYLHKYNIAPPSEWGKPHDAFVAISKDNGKTWHYKTLPAGLPQDNRPPYTSMGYTTIRQSTNGIIHVLATKDYPGLHYEFNEAWVWSNDGDIQPEMEGGEVKSFKEFYPSGQLKSEWSARICPNGRYLLDGIQKEYFSDGKLEHQALYKNGRKVGREVFMNKDGSMRWSWDRSLVTNRGTWTHYWPNGKKKIESRWKTHPTARDADRQFFGYVADGPSIHYDQDGKVVKTYLFKDGVLLER